MKTGIYTYAHAVSLYPVPKLERYKMRVEILEERGKSYRVRFLEYHADGRGPNTVSTVLQKSVKVRDEDPAPVREMRLPYKD